LSIKLSTTELNVPCGDFKPTGTCRTVSVSVRLCVYVFYLEPVNVHQVATTTGTKARHF